MAIELKKPSITRVVFLTSVTFRKTEFGHLIAERDRCSLEFDKGLMIVKCDKTGETVVVPVTNVKHWALG